MWEGTEVMYDVSLPRVPCSHNATPATSDRAPTKRLARAGVAAAGGGSGPNGTGGVAAWRGSGVQRPDRHVACNIIVGPYCVSFKTGGL